MGAALYPRDGACFKELFASADHALYTVKGEGKGSFQLFDSTVEREHYTIQMEDSRLHQSVLNDDRQKLVLRVFRLLYEAEERPSGSRWVPRWGTSAMRRFSAGRAPLVYAAL